MVPLILVEDVDTGILLRAQEDSLGQGESEHQVGIVARRSHHNREWDSSEPDLERSFLDNLIGNPLPR